MTTVTIKHLALYRVKLTGVTPDDYGVQTRVEGEFTGRRILDLLEDDTIPYGVEFVEQGDVGYDYVGRLPVAKLFGTYPIGLPLAITTHRIIGKPREYITRYGTRRHR